MMDKLCVFGASALMSLGMLALPQQAVTTSDPEPRDGPKTVAKAEFEKVVNLADPSDDLHEAYVTLRVLRRERLADRPKQLTDRAVVMYRDGLKALELGDEAKARALGEAARDLSRAVELSLSAQRTEQADPDLPPPPRRTKTFTYKIAGPEVEPAIPPPLPTDGAVDYLVRKAPGQDVLIQQGQPKGEFRVMTKAIRVPGGDPQHGVVIVGTPEGDDQPSVERHIVIGEPLRGHEQAVEALKERLKSVGQAHARVLQERTVRALAGDAIGDVRAQARRDLNRAYERIREARSQVKGDDAKLYLDAARDLYNAARRDAEAGRNERASELARAAEALTLVPKHLSSIKESGKKAATKSSETRVESTDGRVRVYRFENKDEVKKEKDAPEKKEIRRFEYRIEKSDKDGDDKKPEKGAEERKKAKKESGDKGASSGSATEKPDSIAGVGLALRFEDDKVIVNQVLAGSPAAKNGHIKTGDRILGVEKDGKKVEFAGQEAAAIVKMLRGPSGTKVHLIVERPDAGEPAIYELTRGKLEVPKSVADDDDQEAKIESKSFRLALPLQERDVLKKFRLDELKSLNLDELKSLKLDELKNMDLEKLKKLELKGLDLEKLKKLDLKDLEIKLEPLKHLEKLKERKQLDDVFELRLEPGDDGAKGEPKVQKRIEIRRRPDTAKESKKPSDSSDDKLPPPIE